MFNVKTLLVPIDFHPASRAAFDVAKVLAERFSADLVVLHVVPPSILPENGATSEREAALVELAKLSRSDGGAIERVALIGDEEGAIVQQAVARRCDLIVMGTAGRSGIGRLMLGSVAEHVSRNAPCPVLLVKAPRGGTSTSSEQGNG
jgi:nucleotide-binding universal stress UspA family protein